MLRIFYSRVKSAESKIEVLKNDTKATCIYSAAKYPGQDYQPYQSALTLQPNSAKRSLEKRKRGTAEKSSARTLHSVDISEKLHFYHVRTPKQPESSAVPKKSMPNKIKSCSSLLVYDTDVSPYHKVTKKSRNGFFKISPKRHKQVTNISPKQCCV